MRSRLEVAAQDACGKANFFTCTFFLTCMYPKTINCLCRHYCRAHEAWNLPTPPDFVTFAKKMQLGGFFYRSSARPKEVRIDS